MADVRVTSRPRAGRRFAPTHELALLPSALGAAAGVPGANRGLVVVQEATGPFGIPDLTALVGAPGLLADRQGLDIAPLLHQVDAAIVAVAHPRLGRSSASLARSLGWPEATVERRLSGLVRAAALSEARPGKFVRPAALRPLGRVYAVEAKVREWSQALRQVRRYSVWADGYVLVMGPLPQRSLALLEAEVARDGGGLVVDDQWLRRPTVQRLPAARRMWASEHVVAALEGYQPSVTP